MPFPRPATTRSAPFRRIVKFAAVIGGVVVVVLIVLTVAFAVLMSGFSKIGTAERKHLDPIPIAANACPYVKLMHEAANRFQIAYPIFGISVDANQHQLTWPQTRQRLRHAADVFEVAIVAGTPHFPKRVRNYLDVTRVELVGGRRQLAAALDAFDFTQRTMNAFDAGKTAFGFAGDLIGHRCQVELGASDVSMLDP